jgi:hypothetical protein
MAGGVALVWVLVVGGRHFESEVEMGLLVVGLGLFDGERVLFAFLRCSFLCPVPVGDLVLVYCRPLLPRPQQLADPPAYWRSPTPW